METTVAPRSRAGRWWAAVAGAGLLLSAALIAGLVLLTWAAYRALDPTPDRHLVIATGPEQGDYIEFAKHYVPLLKAQGLEVELRKTQGSSENLALLRDPRSGVHAAFVQGGADGADAAQETAVESLGSVALEPVWIFYRLAAATRHLGTTAPTRLSQLAGWHIETGPVGAGAQALFRQLAAANGLEPAQLALGDKPTVLGVVDLLQGRTDALLIVAAADAPLVQFLLHTPGIGLFEFGQADAYARRFPFLRPVTLLRGIVDLAADRPPRDVRLLAVTALLVARADLHPALVQLLVQAAQQVHGAGGWLSAPGEFPNPSLAELPIAPEARRYYRDGVPWLQRHLPFWLANFIDRMWIVLVPLLAALIPLSRVLPPLVRIRVRSRVYRWYAHLRAVEHALEGPAPALQGLLDEVERIDRQTERIGVPLSYTHELYALRSHIQLVRGRILDRVQAQR
jgi:TRAP-type uncharacterized transport system substrate-binding protein